MTVKGTRKQLMAENAAAAKEAKSQSRARFNCCMQIQAVSMVNVCVLKAEALSQTKMVDVPFLTNNEELEDGEELILEIHEKAAKAAKKRGWKDLYVKEQKELEKKLQKEPQKKLQKK